MTVMSSIRPGELWLDTNGQPIQAHGGSVITVDGVYYWYGENKEHTTGRDDIWHWGVRCYSSDDLYNWTDLGTIIPPVPDDPASPLHPHQQMDRPHIIYNDATRKFVCWVKVMGETQESTVLVADQITGPYSIVRTGLRPLGMSAGDFDLIVDPRTERAYYYFERVHSDMICAELTDDYTDVTGIHTTHFPHDAPPEVREAPAFFTRQGRHYLITSGTSGYYPNPSEIAVAESYHGPWTVLGDPHSEDTTGTSFGSQVSSVFRHPLKKDLYIAIADRWLPDASVEKSHRAVDAFRRAFAGDDSAGAEIGELLSETDTSQARYVWLPVRFDGEYPRIVWEDEWRVEDWE